MLSFLGLSGKKAEKQQTRSYAANGSDYKLGDLRGDKNIGEQLNELKGRVDKTMTKNKNELHKYKELVKFNEKLTKSYVANLKVISNISTLLKAYNEFFDMFKGKLSELDEELENPLSLEEFDYMRQLTNEQLVQLNDLFTTETSNLKKLYSRYGRQKEYDEVETAEKLFEDTRNSSKDTYKVLKSNTAVNSSVNSSFNTSNTNTVTNVSKQQIGGRKKTQPKKTIKKKT